MSPRAEALTKEMETFAVAARSPREGPGIADIGATDELTGSENEMGSLGDGRAADFVAQDASTDLVWKAISGISQSMIITDHVGVITSIRGRLISNRPEGQQSYFWFTPSGNATSRVVNCTMGY